MLLAKLNIAYTPKMLFYVLGNGNHRIVFKYRNNERFIDGYFLPFDVHIHAIISNYRKLIVMVHYNLCKIGEHEYGGTDWTLGAARLDTSRRAD